MLMSHGYLQLQTHEQSLHIAAADAAPGLDLLVNGIAREVGGAPDIIIMDDNNTDWNSLYPFSSVCSRSLQSMRSLIIIYPSSYLHTKSFCHHIGQMFLLPKSLSFPLRMTRSMRLRGLEVSH